MTIYQNRRQFLQGIAAIGGGAYGFFRCHTGNASEVGQIYPGWREGEFDIHSILTGRGEATLYIFPDGTTLLIDTGDWYPKEENRLAITPDNSRTAGEWVARYIRRINPNGENVNYMLLSHYHPDHGGKAQDGVKMTTGRGEDYALSGLAEVGEILHFDQAFDRGYPDYNNPVPVVENPTAENFRRFTRWAMREKGLQMEKFEVGALDQIKLRKNPSAYDFHIRNLSANGEVWTGKGTDVHDFLPDWPERIPKENPLSLSMTFHYGDFRYFAGGDLDTAIQTESGVVPIEAAVGRAAGPVDHCKVNHHACANATTPEFVQGVQARTYMVTVWAISQPSDPIMERLSSEELYPGPRLICPVYYDPERQKKTEGAPWRANVTTDNGHLVTKVYENGKKYKIYYLTAEDESMRIKAVYGPFESSGAQRYAAYNA